MDDLAGLGLNNAAWAAALAVVAATVARFGRDRPALVHGLWLFVLLKLVTPGLVVLAIAPTAVVDEPVAISLAPGRVEPPDLTLVPTGMAPVVLAKPEPVRPQPTPRPWRRAMVWAWLAGAGAWWGLVGLQTARFGRLMRSSRPASAATRERALAIAARVGLRGCPEVSFVPARVPPMLWALVGRPRLVLPEALWDRLDDDQRDAVLAHELSHLKRRDHWVRRLEAIVLGLYWWDPVAWWARREVGRAEEECCDARVALALPGKTRAYAEALVRTADFLSGPRHPWPAGASGVGRIPLLKRRLTMILRDPYPGPTSRPAARALVLLGALALPLLPTWAEGRAPEAAIQEPAPKAALPRDDVPRGAKPDDRTVGGTVGGVVMPPGAGEPRVKAVRPVIREIRDSVDYTGKVEPQMSADIRARLGGSLLAVRVQPGEMVKRGDILFEIDPRSYEIAVQKAESQVTRAKAQRRQVLSVIARNRAYLKRNASLVSQEEVTKAETELEVADADLKLAESSLELARLELSFTKVLAPIDGQIGRTLPLPGAAVVADTTSLATLASVDPVLLYFDVSERSVLRINRLKREGKAKLGLEAGLPVLMELADESGYPHVSKLDAVSNRFDPDTGTLRLRATFANPDRAIIPGMSARVRLVTGEPRRAMLVPAGAVGLSNDPDGQLRQALLVVTDQDQVERRFVKVGEAQDGFKEITEGLKAEEWVVAQWNQVPIQRLNPKIHPDRVASP